MKSFKVREGKMLIDGVYYSDSPSTYEVKGKMGRIHSISISGKQFFPYAGEFNDGTTPSVDTTTPKTKSLPKTELVEKSGVAVDESGKLIKRKTKKG